MFSSKKKTHAAAAAAQARQEAALRGAGLGISPSLANRKEHERTTSASTTASRATTGLASPPLASPIFGIPPPPPAAASANAGIQRQWNGQLHERTESNSTSTTATAEKGLASPQLGLTFDFELPPSPALSSGDAFGTEAFFGPSTSDGPQPNVGFGEETGRKSSVTAPVLPPLSQTSNLREELAEEEDEEPLAAVQTRLRRPEEPVQKVQEVPRQPKAPPPPIPIAPAPVRDKAPSVSSPAQRPPPSPRLPSDHSERSSSPALQLPPRLSSRTPSAERLPTTSSSQPPPPRQAPPIQVPKQTQIPFPPPPSIPPPPPPETPTSKDRQRDNSDNVSTHSNKSKRSRIKSFFFDRPNPDFLSQSRPSSSAGPTKMSNSPQDLRPSTSAGSTPMMESSLFPRKEPSIPRQDSMPIMNRAWLDARDKPYQNATPKAVPPKPPYLQQARSTPDLLASATNPAGTSRTPSMPLNIVTNRSPLAASASADPSPHSPRLTFVRPAGTFPKTPISAEDEVSPSPTVGTPYQRTSPQFPLPQHVSTRPKTAGAATSTVGGVNVPTHYSSNSSGRPETSAGAKDEKSDKKERRKTRLLNPVNLFTRRKSGEEEEAARKREAAAVAQKQAFTRQKTLISDGGVRKVPENYDPRIRGKAVHDFSAPRHGRAGSTYTTDGSEPAWNAVARGLQSAHSAPFLPTDGRDSQASGSGGASSKHLSVSTMATSSTGPDRRSRNVSAMGAFHEHLSETPDRGSRISSLQAERRENKDFLQRASHLSQQSQESGVLPPFARRNQTWDSSQSFADSASERSGQVSALSNRWKDNRDSNVSAMSGISPVAARTISTAATRDAHQSFSPVSPTSPSGSKLGSESAISPPGNEDRPSSSYFSNGLAPSGRPAVSPLEDREKTASPAPARSPARSATEPVVDVTTPKSAKDKKKGFSIKIPFASRNGGSDASGSSGRSPITSPTSRSMKSAKSARSTKSARSLANTPSLHSLPSNQPTPEPQIAEPAVVVGTKGSKSPKLVEKLATAVGHGKRSGSKKDKLEHQVSNASRFSFQFGGSAAEELALEEKARKMRANGDRALVPSSNQGGFGEEDDDDFFDEDAMDDMDEMELQAQSSSEIVQGEDGSVTNYVGGKPLTLQQQVQLLQAQQAEAQARASQQPSPNQTPQAEQPDPMATATSATASLNPNPARASQFMYRTATPTAPARNSKPSPKLQLDIQENDSGVSESDSDPDADPDDEAGYWDNDDFMGYEHSSSSQSQLQSSAHTREPSVVTAVATSPAVMQGGSPSFPPGSANGVSTSTSPKQPRRQRGASAASAHGLTLNTNVGPGSAVPAPAAAPPADVRAAAATFVQDTMNQQARGGFYMQPAAAGRSSSALNTMPEENVGERPALPHRDSGNSERNRVASGLNFAAPDAGVAGHKAALSSSTLGSNGRSTISGSSSSGPRTTSTGLGLSVFSEFKFTDSAPSSRPLSLEKANQNRRSTDSETIPRDVNWTDGSPALNQHGRSSSGWTSVGNGMQPSPLRLNGAAGATGQTREKTTYIDMGDDDVYFDDGGFDLDIAEGSNVRGSVNEAAFDEDAFDFDRVNGVGQAVQPPARAPPGPPTAPQGHSRPISALTVTSLGSDGPYPSFAMPNAAKARQRDSRYMLEDLPLQEQSQPVDPKLIPRRNPSEDAKRLGLSDKVPPLPAQPGSLDAAQRVSANLQAYHSALAAAANKAAAEGRFSRMPSLSTASVYSQGEGDGTGISRDTSHYSRDEDEDPLPTDAVGVNGTTQLSQDYTSPKMSNFDFGFDGNSYDDDLDDLANDDDIVAAANAEALASDDEGFYGQEFGFYAKARPNSGEVQALIGGYFGEDGDDGLNRNRSTKEPNLTPITERSEFSTRNSFIGGIHGFGPASAGAHPMSAGSMSSLSPALARLPYSPLMDGEVTSFDQLRKLRAHAFGGSNASLSLGGSNGSLHSAGSEGRNSNASLHMASDSPTWSTRSSAAAQAGQGYFGAPMVAGGSSESEGSSNAASAYPQLGFQPPFHDSPHSAASSGHLPFSIENEATPKRQPPRDSNEAPLTARKSPPPGMGIGKPVSHSRKSSKDSVTYVQEQDPAGTGQPRWVLERRRTSEQGQLELVAREIVQGGWI